MGGQVEMLGSYYQLNVYVCEAIIVRIRKALARLHVHCMYIPYIYIVRHVMEMVVVLMGTSNLYGRNQVCSPTVT